MRNSCIAILLLLVSSPGAVRAEDWLPVVVDHPEAEETMRLLRRVIAALRTEQDVYLPDPATAARRFEALHSAEPVDLPDAELRRLGDSVSRALQHAALNDWKRAHEEARAFDELSQSVQDYVKLRLDLSDDVLDYCLMSVQFMLRAGRTDAAREEMRRCVHGSPNQRPEPKKHETEVLQLHDEVREELLQGERASLHVDVNSPSTEGCVAVVNGQAKGALPYREVGLLPLSVRVQVNCQEVGRVHTVKLAPGRNSVVVDRRFERVVHTSDYLALRYRSAAEERKSQIADALALGRLFEVKNVLLVQRTGQGRVSLRRIELEKVVAEVTIDLGAGDEEVRAAAEALSEGLSGDIEPSAPLASVRVDEPKRDLDWIMGLVPAAAGAGLYAVAWANYGALTGARDRFVAERLPATLTRYDDVLVAIHTTAAFGAGLTAASVPMLLPDADGVPLWSWLTGTAGLGVAATGIALWHRGQRCGVQACDPDATEKALGQLVLLHSAPLLALPFTHGIRALLGTNQLQGSAHYTPNEIGLTVVGRF